MGHLFFDGEESAAKHCKVEADDGFAPVPVPSKKRSDLQLMADHLNEPIKLASIRDFILWLFADGLHQRWIFLKNRAAIRKVCVVVSEDCSVERGAILKAVDASGVFPMHLLGEDFGHFFNGGAVRTIAAVERQRVVPPAETLLNCVRQQRRLSLEPGPPFSETNLLLSEAELKANDFPAHTEYSRASEPVGVHSLLALDCEMVLTEKGQALARVSLVTRSLETLYDSFVKPDLPIVDYLTRYNGITEETLSDVVTTFEDAQQQVLSHLTAETILVGHSLENDLEALRIVHNRVIDTSVVFKHPQYPDRKHSLKHITKRYLNRTIQDGSHDSVEDARAAMELALAKLQNGPKFGVEADHEGICDRIKRFRKSAVIAESVSDAIEKLGSTAELVLLSSKAGELQLEQVLPLCKQLSEHLPKYGVLLFVNGANQIRRASSLFEKRMQFYRTKEGDIWNDALEGELRLLCDDIREGYCLFRINK